MWLEVLSGEDAGRVVEVDRPLVLGRVAGSDLVIRDARASRRHVELAPIDGGGGVSLRDLDSANGTLVDGLPARELMLRGGEEIRIGDVRIAVLEREPAATGAPIPDPERPPARRLARGEGPSWSTVGRLVEARTRRGRRLTYTALGVAAAAVAVLAGLLLTGALTGESDDERVAEVVRTVAPATVRVEARGGGGAQASTGTAWGLGDDLVVTAAHVLNPGQTFLAGGAEAEVAGVDPCLDLAVLRAPDATESRLALDEAEPAEQGETVLAFGFPQSAGAGEPVSSTRGVVSAASADYGDPAADVPAYEDAIRTDTVLDSGFSGGPLVDLAGRIVGINAAVRSDRNGGRPLQGANYAIAAERSRAAIEELAAGRSSAWIGASFGYPTTEELAASGRPPGLFIRGVVEGFGAAAAGLRDGDYIVAVDGQPLDGTLSGWCAAAGDLRSGATARLELAGGRSVEVRVG